MPITREDITHLARLARLKTDPDQAECYAAQLSRIMQLVKRIQRVDTEHVEPMAHPLDLTLRLRADTVTAPNRRDAYQKIAPATQDGLYLVPKVIE